MALELKSYRDILPPNTDLSVIIADCKAAFNCRSLSTGKDNYSAGATYFVKASDKPTNNLESLALQLFQHHTRDISFDPSNSGAEWWTQAIDSRDDIGFHWDRDYGAEEDRGEHIYPMFATVTYLTDAGGHTIIVDRKGTSSSDELVIGSATRFAASRPRIGKHIAFNGSLLHAAPSDLKEDSDSEDGSEEEDDSNSGSEDSDSGTLRITFLVNIWVNHIPSQSKRFPKKDLKKFQPLKEGLKLTLKEPETPTVVSLSRQICTRVRTWSFNNGGVNYDVKVPLPSKEETEQHLEHHDFVEFDYAAPQESGKKKGSNSGNGGSAGEYAGHGIEVLFSEDQPSDEGEDDDEGDGSEEEGEGSEEGSDDAKSDEGEVAPQSKKRRY